MINVDELCVLKLQNGKLIMTYEPIEDNFKKERSEFRELCMNDNDNIGKIIAYIGQTYSLRKLQRKYDYCEILGNRSNKLHVKFEDIIHELNEERQSLIKKIKNDKIPYSHDSFYSDISILKKSLLDKFETWLFAFNIMKTYDKCDIDKSVIAYSHKKRGWLSYKFRLTEYLTFEIKTNFGFGNASYFYITIEYKGLVVNTFSDWITYKYVNYSDIIRYTRSFTVKFNREVTKMRKKREHELWKTVMDYSLKAGNISLKDEELFLNEYIIKECELMVEGLEDIYSNDKISEEIERVDKNGHKRISYKAEKISGALDFISRLLEFQNDLDVRKFILDIKNINIKYQPLLEQETKKIDGELKKLYPKHLELEIEYNAALKKQQKFMDSKTIIRKKINKNKSKETNIKEATDKEFETKFPNYKEFEKEFHRLIKKWNKSEREVYELETLLKKLLKCNDKILSYLKKDS